MTADDPGPVAPALLRLLSLIVGTALVIVCAVYLLGSWLSAPSWATTQGIITSSYVDTSSYTEAGERVRFERTRYHASVSYRFQVSGREYTGDGLGDGHNPIFDRRGDAEAALAPFRTGPGVTVYYDPANPERSALVLGYGSRLAWIFGGIGLALVIGGLSIKSEPKDET